MDKVEERTERKKTEGGEVKAWRVLKPFQKPLVRVMTLPDSLLTMCGSNTRPFCVLISSP